MKIRINCWKILLRQSAAKDFMFYDIYTKETWKNITQGSTTREDLVGSSDSETSELLND